MGRNKAKKRQERREIRQAKSGVSMRNESVPVVNLERVVFDGVLTSGSTIKILVDPTEMPYKNGQLCRLVGDGSDYQGKVDRKSETGCYICVGKKYDNRR